MQKQFNSVKQAEDEARKLDTVSKMQAWQKAHKGNKILQPPLLPVPSIDSYIFCVLHGLLRGVGFLINHTIFAPLDALGALPSFTSPSPPCLTQ